MFKAQTHSPSLKPDQRHISLAKHNALSSVISDEMHMTMNRSYTYYVLFAILSLPRDREYASSSLDPYFRSPNPCKARSHPLQGL